MCKIEKEPTHPTPLKEKTAGRKRGNPRLSSSPRPTKKKKKKKTGSAFAGKDSDSLEKTPQWSRCGQAAKKHRGE